MSAQKQCPKCGEKNPAEAVMCWACYTSLTGGGAGAAALAGAGGSIGGGATISDTDEKKKIDPKHLAIIGVGLLVAAGFGVTTMMGGGEEVLDMPAATSVTKPSSSSSGDPPPSTQPVGEGGNPVGPGNNNPNQNPPGPTVPVYRVIVSPHPRQSWGTMALVSSNENITEGQAKTFILDAKQKIERRKKFPAMEVFVITDAGAGGTFSRFQNRRKGAPLTESEYTSPSLSSVWPKTILRYVKNGNTESYVSPMRNPSGFWRERGR